MSASSTLGPSGQPLPVQLYLAAIGLANRVGEWAPGLALRLLLAYEFWESGLEKWRGENWFADLQANFPFPFSVIPADISWQMATWTELIGPVCLVLGLGTRFWAVSLSVLTIVAWAAVHAGNGYNVCDNGFKLPLIYLVLFVPLMFQGAGRLSLDAVIARRWGRPSA